MIMKWLLLVLLLLAACAPVEEAAVGNAFDRIVFTPKSLNATAGDHEVQVSFYNNMNITNWKMELNEFVNESDLFVGWYNSSMFELDMNESTFLGIELKVKEVNESRDSVILVKFCEAADGECVEGGYFILDQYVVRVE